MAVLTLISINSSQTSQVNWGNRLLLRVILQLDPIQQLFKLATAFVLVHSLQMCSFILYLSFPKEYLANGYE